MPIPAILAGVASFAGKTAASLGVFWGIEEVAEWYVRMPPTVVAECEGSVLSGSASANMGTLTLASREYYAQGLNGWTANAKKRLGCNALNLSMALTNIEEAKTAIRTEPNATLCHVYAVNLIVEKMVDGLAAQSQCAGSSSVPPPPPVRTEKRALFDAPWALPALFGCAVALYLVTR